MNHWARMLSALPATAQRQIARYQRISLPRGCDAITRQQRLRQALCHAATVRSCYHQLDLVLQEALQQLRHCRGGLSPAALIVRYGPLRPWSQIAADLQPQSISEQLVLLGWLLPRAASPHNPMHYILPPELRRWLPVPIQLPALGPAPRPTPLPLALQLATVLLLECTRQPLSLRQDGRLTTPSVQRLSSSLPAADRPAFHAAAQWVWSFLLQLGLTTVTQQEGRSTPAAERFLALPATRRMEQLQTAWIAQPQPDAWLTPLLVEQRGIDWPCLRRRLLQWAAALPQGLRVARSQVYPALSAFFGPLADAQTHGFRTVQRRPWNEARSQMVWEAALDGPLAWLGIVMVQDECVWRSGGGESGIGNWESGGVGAWERGSVGENRPPACQSARSPAPSTAIASHGSPISYSDSPTAPPPAHATGDWQLASPGILHISHQDMGRDALRLAHWMEPLCVDADGITLRITLQSRARAARQGLHDSQLRALLERHAGVLPEDWQAWLVDQPALRLEAGALLTADAPAVLDQLLRQRSMRRQDLTRLAPGIALLDRDARPALQRHCERQGISMLDLALPVDMPPASSLTPGESAALLMACAFYRQHAPADAPFLPTVQTEQRLAAGLTPALRRALEPVLEELSRDRGSGIGDQESEGQGVRSSECEGGRGEPSPPIPRSHCDGSGGIVHCGAIKCPAPACGSGDGEEGKPEDAPSVRDEAWGGGREEVGTYSTRTMHHATLLKAAIERKATLRIGYSPAHGRETERLIRPLRLEQRPTGSYLTAYCCLRRAERTFRLDRIRWIVAHGSISSAASCCLPTPPTHQAPAQHHPMQQSNHIVGRVGADAPNPNDLDTLHGNGIQPIAAHTIRVWIDDGQQLSLQRGKEPVIQEALEDTVLDMGAIALHKLEHLRAPLVIDHIIADDSEHVVLLE